MNQAAAAKTIKLELMDASEKNIYDLRCDNNNQWLIGSAPIRIEGQCLHVNNEKYPLTKGLLSLLTK